MKRLPHDQYVELAVIMNFIRYTPTEKDMCTFFIFVVSAVCPRDTIHTSASCVILPLRYVQTGGRRALGERIADNPNIKYMLVQSF